MSQSQIVIISPMLIIEFLRSEGYPDRIIRVRDRRYALIPEVWYFGELARSFEAFKILNDLRFAAEAYDCDDFADAAALHARLAHYRSGLAPGTAIPFGNYGSVAPTPQGTREPHQKNCAVCLREIGPISQIRLIRPEHLYLIHFEPQSSNRVTVDSEEKLTCNEIRF